MGVFEFVIGVLGSLLAIVLSVVVASPVMKLFLREIGFNRWLEKRLDRKEMYLAENERLRKMLSLVQEDNDRLREEIHVLRYSKPDGTIHGIVLNKPTEEAVRHDC